MNPESAKHVVVVVSATLGEARLLKHKAAIGQFLNLDGVYPNTSRGA
jgi:hypothetical protein